MLFLILSLLPNREAAAQNDLAPQYRVGHRVTWLDPMYLWTKQYVSMKPRGGGGLRSPKGRPPIYMKKILCLK